MLQHLAGDDGDGLWALGVLEGTSRHASLSVLAETAYGERRPFCVALAMRKVTQAGQDRGIFRPMTQLPWKRDPGADPRRRSAMIHAPETTA